MSRVWAGATDISEMADTPNISVIVPVYNGEETVEACIQSLLSLDYPEDHFELIFVDNACTDRTAKILNKYDLRVRTCFEPKRGPARPAIAVCATLGTKLLP